MQIRASQIQASAEDYLETILLLSRENGSIRSKNIVEEMGFSKPSVSVAMKKLREKELIHMDADGFITLTSKGNEVANQVYDRHSTLYNWLLRIGVSEATAATDACRMEHILSDETIQKIKNQGY
ncbi:MAG: metal-dependent transcriptional regulator [Clostridium sp.]|jgi:Mn-dependent DtxR family transcriptional regulator|nr:metal-dependent transcriptional regulator [Clostridium sp.]